MNDVSPSLPPLWRALALVAPLEARVSGVLPGAITGISIDSRSLVPGDLFFAIRGDNTDGHDYVTKAFAAGAGAAVVDEAHADGLRGSGPLLIVQHVQGALERLGMAARQRATGRIAAITGSVGKTSSKEALALMLRQAGQTHAAVASFNNHWGVPLTLARMPESSRFGVFEIGMNHAGEITPLVAMVRPHVAMITTVAPVHLEHFASVDDIARAKGEIFSGLMPGGVAVINCDIGQFELLAGMARQSPARHIMSFGRDASADARLLEADVRGDATHVKARVLGQDIAFVVGAAGAHFAQNALGLLLVARAMGLDLHEAAAALAAFGAPRGRGEVCVLHLAEGEARLIDESYNANPASMRAALAVLGAATPGAGGRRIAVLGDMLELGEQSGLLHRGLAEDIEQLGIDQVFTVGRFMGELHDTLPQSRRAASALTSVDMIAPVRDYVGPGDVIMVKGSNSSKMGLIVAALRDAFANRAPAEDIRDKKQC
ncbi:MAG: UDP-N-acetylmuramoylalanyl-D-glutamyl-2,6-diaminopimelate--D-alanyl-D-alanine ligase [Hyphomicrobiales bacterium]|nr:UDP-N-acetylmuramoylalanyl-D-glutamyl-2,6-diaminopimelate--D-alanyl-D-alanine ligase [Hyphomicrobiales bacterium]